jgi:hypothetical protein
VPSFIPVAVKNNPDFTTLVLDTKKRINKYQAMLDQLENLTGGKVHVRMWSGGGDWEPALAGLKSKIENLASKPNAVAWLKEENNCSALTDKALHVDSFQDYLRSDEFMTIEPDTLVPLGAAIDVILAAHP